MEKNKKTGEASQGEGKPKWTNEKVYKMLSRDLHAAGATINCILSDPDLMALMVDHVTDRLNGKAEVDSSQLEMFENGKE